MYRGIERRIEINHDQLEEGFDYACRVCAIRVCGDGTQLAGPYSSNVNFHVPSSTLREDPLSTASSKCHSLSSKSQVKASHTFFTVSFIFCSKRYWVQFLRFVLMFFFVKFQTLQEKMSRISYESRVGIMAVFALIIVAFFISLITHHVVS